MTKQKLLIGISGKMGSGKSTISHMLKAGFEMTDRKVEIMSLSKPLYKAQDLLYKQFGLELQGDKDRNLLISIGQWGRDIDPDFWVEQAAKSIVESDADIIICDDIRFKNEADFFKRLGVIFRIEGEQRGDNVDHSKATDATECSLDDYKFDNVIHNNKSPDDMCMEIATIMGGGNGNK